MTWVSATISTGSGFFSSSGELESVFRLYLLVLLAAENLSNWPSPNISWHKSFISAVAFSLFLMGNEGWNRLQGSFSGGGLKSFLWAGGVSMLSESISALSGLPCLTSLSVVIWISGSFRLSSSVIETRGTGVSICCRERCLRSRSLISSFSSVFLHGTLVSFFGWTSGNKEEYFKCCQLNRQTKLRGPCSNSMTIILVVMGTFNCFDGPDDGAVRQHCRPPLWPPFHQRLQGRATFTL